MLYSEQVANAGLLVSISPERVEHFSSNTLEMIDAISELFGLGSEFIRDVDKQ